MMKNDSNFILGELVQLVDEKGGVKTVSLNSGKTLHTHQGEIKLDDLIGKPEGGLLASSLGNKFRAFRPKRSDAILSLPRGAAIIYPKDSSAILTYGDIFPGARVLEAGLGSGALTIQLLCAAGKNGEVVSVEKREDFFKTAKKNVEQFFRGANSGGGQILQAWKPELTDLFDYLRGFSGKNEDKTAKFDRIILDLLNPWDFVEGCQNALVNGGILTCYVTTVPQLQELSKVFGKKSDKFEWVNVEAFEIIRRPWKLEDLSIRPEHQGILHSGWIVCAKCVENSTSAR